MVDRRERRRRRRRTRALRGVEDTGLWLLVGLIVIAPQLLGGVFGWGISVIVVAAGAACVAATWRARDRLPPVQSLVWLGVFTVGFTGLQALPLPRSLVEALQPSVVQIASDTSVLLEGSPPSWLALSYSPVATLTELTKGLAIVAAFFTASLVTAGGHRRRVLLAVAASVVAMAGVGLAHLAVGTDEVFGLYAPVDTRSPLLAPLMNQNHLSGFLAMGVPLLVGLGLDEKVSGRRLAWFAAATVVGGCAAFSISRGGIVSLVAGLVLLPVVGLASKRRARSGRLTAWLGLGAVIAAVLAVGLYVGSRALMSDFASGDTTKLDFAARGFGMALDHPFVGVGRGAFAEAFVAVMGSRSRITHPENLPVQWVSEWGLVVGLALLVVVMVAVVRASRAARTWSHVGGVAAIGSLFVHELVDFSTEMVGVAVVAAALLGAVTGRRFKESPPAGARRLGVGITLGTACLLSAAILGWRIDSWSIPSLQAELTARLEQGDPVAFRSELVRAVTAHPSEPSLLLLGGAEAVRRDDPVAIAWLNQAMRLAPGWDAPHTEIARFLARRGRLTQAFGEVVEAERRREGAAASVACHILEYRPQATEELVRVAGEDEPGSRLLDRVARCLGATSPAVNELDEVLSQRGLVSARVRRARRVLRESPDEAITILEPVADSDDYDVQMTRARAFLRADRPERAAEVLRGIDAVPARRRQQLRLLARACTAARDEEAAREATAQLRVLSAGDANRVAAVWVFEGDLERQLGNTGRALHAFERAHRLDPAGVGLARVAVLSAEMGQLTRAYRAYGELCRRGEERFCRARDRLRERSAESPGTAPQPRSVP